ncbi:hypothetical protein O3M35_000766 [Rhynocoris fuscipes]|uniref:DNA-directed DNA polymerase n=1 Tax=Rhynocoris fuscipes TaxID=488301 RepID=A0AAW1DNH7_9HEMI
MTDCNPEQDSIYITYQDCNNLYGHTMSQPSPYSDFQWLPVENFDLNSIFKDGEVGWTLNVDIDYPTHLHTLHNHFPFLPENIKINNNNKLGPHLDNRKNYIVHYTHIRQALRHGLILTKLNRILQFRQSCWLKPYIDLNTNLRTRAANDFERDLYKLYNNAVYGKTMENLRKRINLKLVSCPKKIEKLVARTEFTDRVIHAENLCAVHLAKRKILLNKPMYVGMSILDLSKVTMYSYHYEVMLPMFGHDRLTLAYIDTDSFIYKILTDDLYKDMVSVLDKLDTSNYPTDHILIQKTKKL